MGDYAILNDDQTVAPCKDVITWAKWVETADRRIARTKVGNVTVSTVFLGVDHSFGDGPPLWFETMIFGGKHDEEQWRYATRREAVDGHVRIVKQLEAAEAGTEK